MSKKSRFRGLFEEQDGKGAQTLLKSERYHLCNVYWSLGRKASWKKFLLVICKDIRLFVKTFTAADKCFLLHRENLRQPIEMQLSQKQKFISQFVSAFLQSTLNFEHFQNMMTLIADLFVKLRTPKNMVKYVSKMSRFRGPFKKTHGKGDQTLFESEQYHLYHIS